MKTSIAILCPDCNTGNLKTTVNSIKTYYPEYPFFSVVSNKSQTTELNKFSPVIKAGSTITSLIDEAANKTKTDWVFCVFSGSWIDKGILNKFKNFVKNKKDILFPVVDFKWLFYESSINGLMIHRDYLKEVGEFGDREICLSRAKLLWADKAISAGYTFKAIVGAKLL